jgi:uncharacterized protein with beta-barrel porin domain
MTGRRETMPACVRASIVISATMMAALTLLSAVSEAQAACVPSANGAGPVNTTVICNGAVVDQNAPDGYGTAQTTGNTISVGVGASVKGTTGNGFLLGTNNTIDNSGAIVGQAGTGVHASTISSTVTVNNLTSASSISGAGSAIVADSAATVTNAGSITASGVTSVGISAATTNVTNSGTISSTATSFNALAIVGSTGVTVMNSGSISATGALTVGPTNAIAGGIVNVNNTNTGMISAFGNQAFAVQANGLATVNNSGVISGSTTDVTGNLNGGIFALSSAMVTNSGTISGNGLSSLGMFVSGDLTLSNTGTVSSTGNAFDGIFVNGAANITNSKTGMISTVGDFAFAIENGSGGTLNLTNAGTVSATGISSQGINAFSLSVNNSGSITATGGGGTVGVRARTGGIDNSGMISADIGIQTSANGIVGVETGLTVFNSGTIIGGTGTAIDFISPRLDTLTIAPTSVITGQVLAGTGDTFQLGGTGSGTFSLSSIGAGQQYQGFTAFDKVGSSAWTVTGTGNEAWTIQNGTFIVNGTINGAVNVTGGQLGGFGTVGGTTIANGATLSPGDPTNPTGTLKVTGNLAFQSGALYLLQVSTSGAASTNVSGSATLTGASVQTVFAPGGSFSKSYDILHATGGLGGTTFVGLTGNVPAGFTQSLSYTPTDVFLNLSLPNLGGASGSLSQNQQAVANTINTFFNNGGAVPPGFVNLFGLTGGNLGNALTQLSGEAATGAEKGAFQLTTQFLELLLDPWTGGRGGASAGATGFAPEQAASLPPDVALAYASVLKAPAYNAPTSFDQRWRLWGSAFGGTGKANGDPVVGSNNLTAGDFGVAAGADYRVTPNTVLGFGLAGGGTNWNLAQGLGGGRSNAFQFGLYGKSTLGPAYISAALAFANHWFTTNRTALGDRLSATFEGQSYAARAEAGYRFAWPVSQASLGITPYAALQTQLLRTPSYRESDLSGGGFGLGYNAVSATDTRSELGARFDNLQLVGSMPLILRARLAWAHDWVSNPALQAVFQALPGSNFIVNGAALAANSAIVTTAAELRINANWSLLAKFDGEFASNSQTYAGTGALRYSW